jgi:hypothetical protein
MSRGSGLHYDRAWAVGKRPPGQPQCDLGNGIERVFFLQFDNAHAAFDNRPINEAPRPG